MVQVIDALIAAACGCLGLVLWRWSWLRAERRRLVREAPLDGDVRFEDIRADEADQFFSGRVIRRMRTRVVEGRVEIHWQYHPEYIHKGFFLTGKCRRNDGAWEPLAFEPHQDSGAWSECLNLGESRSYLFTVKKVHRFFFGIFPNDEVETVCDQISFSVRKGKYLKEMSEVMRDKTQLANDTFDYTESVKRLRGVMTSGKDEPQPQAPLQEGTVSRLEARLRERAELTEFIERKRAEILGHPTWTRTRKKAEIEKLEQLAEEAALEEQ